MQCANVTGATIEEGNPKETRTMVDIISEDPTSAHGKRATRWKKPQKSDIVTINVSGRRFQVDDKIFDDFPGK